MAWGILFLYNSSQSSRAKPGKAGTGYDVGRNLVCDCVQPLLRYVPVCVCEREERVWISAVSAAIWGRSMP